MRLLLSCISTRHSILKKHWDETGQSGQIGQIGQASQENTAIECPLTVLGSYQKPKEDTGGLLCLIDDFGCTQKTLKLKMAAGMVDSEHGVLVTAFDSIHEMDAGQGSIRRDVISSPLFNALHSISRTRHGYLVASTGLDLLLELNRKGEALWSWWATDHGFTHTPNGKLRVVDKEADHRVIQYGTLTQTTHVNSAAELPDGRILASLFHQGMVVAIDRETGNWQPVLEGLDHPHAIHILDENHFTVADTVHGQALLVRLPEDGVSGTVEQAIDAGTNWLQDCRYDCWVLVDGAHSRLLLLRGISGDRAAAQIDLDPEWRLYETHVL